MTLASPCIGVCRLDPAQTHCTGCGRSWDEIGAAAEVRAAAALAGDPPTGVLRLERRAPAHTPRDITHLVDPMTGGRALQR